MGLVVGLLELVLEPLRIISLSFRLFGNLFAGDVLLLVISFLLPVVGAIPFYFLELFVGFIQAFVFAFLTLIFMTLGTTVHGHEDAEEEHAAEVAHAEHERGRPSRWHRKAASRKEVCRLAAVTRAAHLVSLGRPSVTFWFPSYVHVSRVSHPGPPARARSLAPFGFPPTDRGGHTIQEEHRESQSFEFAAALAIGLGAIGPGIGVGLIAGPALGRHGPQP